MNVESITPVIRKASGWLILSERNSFCLRDFSRHSSPDVLFCNRGCHRLLGFSCGNRAFGLCHPGAEHRGLSLAGTREFALCNSGSLPVGEPALECSFAESAPGIFLLLEGILELVLYFRLRRSRHSVWLVMDGVGTLILGILMVRQWPPDSPEKIGALIGISLMLSAFSRLMFLLALRALNPAPA